jgi:aspartate/methionine/tyrosine aminotransferase
VSVFRSAYMEWAKFRPKPPFDLAVSNLLACRLEDLPGARAAVDIAGESPEGYPPLREAIAARHGVPADLVAPGGGCSGANFLALAALLAPGDEVLVESPFYDPLPAAARMLGATVSTFARRFEDGFDVDPEAVAARVTDRTRLVVLSNPHNPTGVLASAGSLEALARLAERRGFHVLVDEVYRDTVLEGRPSPAALLSPSFVSTSGLGKAYGLGSLRCGWAIASPDVAAALRRARDVVDVWAPMPSDRIATVAFAHLDRLADRARGIIQANLGPVTRFLGRRPELECVAPRAILAFPRIRGQEDSGPFVDRLLEETGVAVTPGRFFGAPRHFRIAFGGAPDSVAAGLSALERFLDNTGPAA